MYSNKVGLIDIGSNTIRMVIYGIDSHFEIHEITNLKVAARLSQYLINDDHEQIVMADQGIQKLTETLASFNYAARAHEIEELIVFATAAIRQSANQETIIQRVLDETGIEIRILSEKEEASLGQYAISHSLPNRNMVTIDLGGGSCEITLSENKEIKHYHSFPFGVVSLKEKFFAGKEHNDAVAIEKTRRYLQKAFKSLSWLKKIEYPIVAVGGSARNIAQVHQRLQRYPIAGLHGYRLSEINLETTLDLFQTTNYQDMQDIDGLSSDRTDIIIPANLALIELYQVVDAPTLYISRQGLREGIITYYLNDHFDQPIDPEHIHVRSVAKLCRDFKVHPKVAEVRSKIAIDLYKQLTDLSQLNYSYAQQVELEMASYLYKCGQFISQEADSQTTFYLLSNMDLAGFSHRDRVRLALLSSYRNKSLLYQYCQPFVDWFSENDMKELQSLGGILKFSQALNDSKTSPIKKVKLEKKKKDYLLTLYHHGPVVAEQYRAERHSKHIARSLNGSLKLKYVDLDA
ncbi:Ppx/GppA family phosphatase [Facklamia miroungae]|uniref:Exopolyphosphatase / guanosine-5'-triphosphate,3'-diphosphate pyrophosphatase n=1 Tax=Facklamia miroungae TaxID=120956 RepID=A0A1G7RIS0_9LACT|nr:Ppx/GppA family phosphatase [Facklamia miroungae]NKZ29398.1 Ppx/GppA family phosphatase [Facklamia miroungae]SDG10668.1 exopolyphosphatase / guanosine-5'-triphosphate,3'-diphosphate pyrophosphatase [Facklamia miroungae]